MTSVADEPWRLHLISDDQVELHIDLYEESIEVPGMEMFGKMNGYLGGSLYDVWTVTSFKIKSDKAVTLRASNDLGGDAQEISLRQETDSTWVMQFEGGNVVRKLKGKKLVKVPDRYIMKRK